MSTSVAAEDLHLGLRAGAGTLSFGVFFNRQIAKVTSSVSGSGTVSSPDSETTDVVGIALGTSSKTFHVEGGYERALKSDTDPILNKVLTPARITGTIEGRFGSLAIGYTGRLFLDGFFDIDRVIYNQFVSSNSFDEPRLENTFNFSFGTEKGGAFSASVYYTSFTSKELNSFFQNGNKIDTKTTSYGASVKYSFAF